MLRRLRASAPRILRSKWFIGYVVLLGLSHLFIIFRANDAPSEQLPANEARVNLKEVDGQNLAAANDVAVHYKVWPATPESDSVPVILLHGSPSSGAQDFNRFGRRIAEQGRTVYAISFPGYGESDRWVEDYSFKACAHYVLQLMDSLELPRAHLLGWSFGGAVCVHATTINPQRIASITLMGATGVQEGEGSGSYVFERLKYLVGYAGIVALPEVIPHFGLLGPRSLRHAFIRNFLDSDQRPIRGIMRELNTPTYILHGRHDFLVPAWAAEEHHRLIAPSRLVVEDSSHFLAWGTPQELAERIHNLDTFWIRHDAPGVPVLRGAAIFAPQTAAPSSLGWFEFTRSTPWWLLVIVIALLTFISEDLTVIGVGLLVSHQQLDIGVGLVGCFAGIVGGDMLLWALGRFLGRRILNWPFIRKRISEESLEYWANLFEKHTAKAIFLSRCLPGTRAPTYVAAGILSRKTHHFFFWVALAVLIWTPFLLILTIIVGPPLLGFFESVLHGPWAILASFIVLFVIIRFVGYESTAVGRQKLKADLARIRRIEFWPPWIFYLPLIPYLTYLALRYGPMSFTCANPGVPNGGGVVGESKAQILSGLMREGAPVLPFHFIPAGDSPETRTRQAITHIHDDHELGGYPVILKPDMAQRGHAVKLARTDQDVFEYFQSMTRAAVIQKFHPGPQEVGVLWTRLPKPRASVDETPGEIFSITMKTFPVIEGDGQHTLEELIWRHPRFRMQAPVFLKRFESEAKRVLDKGETIPLAVAGNHCQGTRFSDGEPLITEQFSRRIDDIARGYRDPTSGRQFDFGRFDLRYEDEESLKRGEGFAIVELNGTMSESTNLYDPHKSVWWTYSVLFRQWRRLYRIGAARRKEGVRPMRLGELIHAIREHFRGRPGSSVSS